MKNQNQTGETMDYKRTISWTLNDGRAVSITVNLLIEQTVKDTEDGVTYTIPCYELWTDATVPAGLRGASHLGGAFFKRLSPPQTVGGKVYTAKHGTLLIPEAQAVQIEAALAEAEAHPAYQAYLARGAASADTAGIPGVTTPCPHCGGYCHGDCRA